MWYLEKDSPRKLTSHNRRLVNSNRDNSGRDCIALWVMCHLRQEIDALSQLLTITAFSNLRCCCFSGDTSGQNSARMTIAVSGISPLRLYRMTGISHTLNFLSLNRFYIMRIISSLQDSYNFIKRSHKIKIWKSRLKNILNFQTWLTDKNSNSSPSL